MKGRILIVDDDRQMVRTLSDIVALHEWDVDGAYSGEAAVEAIRQHAYDAVLMDVRMTGINGVEAFKAMKAIRPDVRVILMTAFSAAEIITEAEREGALEVLAKPVVLPTLIEMLDQMAHDSAPVLLVGDDSDFLSTLHVALTDRGYDSLEATSLDAALNALESDSPSVVVLDHPFDGVGLGESVLAIKQISPGVALILCDGDHEQGGDGAPGVAPPLIYATLHKPFPPSILINILEDIFAS
jgi:DNA-binding NtrC family response regulator